MRTVLLNICLCLSILNTSVFQRPSDAGIEGNAYVNRFFHFSYKWPAMLVPVDPTTLKLPRPGAVETPLFSAKQSRAPYGVVVIAEYVGPVGRRKPYFRSASDFLELVQRWDPSLHAKVLSRTRAVHPDGLTFEELDYLIETEYSSAIAVEIGDYLVLFRCNANSQADLSEMVRSILAIKRTA